MMMNRIIQSAKLVIIHGIYYFTKNLAKHATMEQNSIVQLVTL